MQNMFQKAIKLLDDDNGGDMTNAFGIGEVNTTLLAELLVIECGLDDAVLDDETHEIWDVVADAAE